MTLSNQMSDAGITRLEEYEIDDSYNPKPDWPGGASGVTWAVGYDAGYATKAQIEEDWGHIVEPIALAQMQKVAGMIGPNAYFALKGLNFEVTREQADEFFRSTDVPRYTIIALATFPNCDKLTDGCFDVLVSLVFNRGASMVDSNHPEAPPHSRLEMRQIRDAMQTEKFNEIPDYLRSMKRLWEGRGLGGLISRYDSEAQIFQGALSGESTPEKPKEELSDADRLNQAELDHIKES